jgi:hypothetical protein
MSAHVQKFLSFDLFITCSILILALLAVMWGYTRHIEESQNVADTRLKIEKLSEALRTGATTPEKLQSAAESQPEILQDGWGRDLRVDDKGVIYSLGADGLDGGEGFAAEIAAGEPRP